ncbi:MAG: MarR family transcriptional regulator [Chloroflexi bacterium]|nr:MarR family transcriptional regulator [Chloroflexota bacterium]
MNQQTERSYVPADEDFKLWRFLDHTRYAISRVRELELARFGLTPEQAYVLDLLSDRGGSTTMNDIMDVTLRQHHTISTLVDRMAKHGLVEKKRSATDGRKYRIVMTKKGGELFQNVTRESITMAFSPLSIEDKRELSSLLKRLLTKAYELNDKQYNVEPEDIPCL